MASKKRKCKNIYFTGLEEKKNLIKYIKKFENIFYLMAIGNRFTCSLKLKARQQTWLLFKATTSLNIFLFDMNFDKSTIVLHFLNIFSVLANF